MSNYTAILFYNSPELNRIFKQNDVLLENVLTHIADVPDLKISRETYVDGSWSWWYSATSPSLDSAALKTVAEKMNGFDGINGSIMLRTAEGKMEFLTPAPTDDRGFGAIDPAFKTGHDPVEKQKPANDTPKTQKKAPKRFGL